VIELTGNSFSSCDNVPRRNVLKAGFLGLGGMTLGQLLQYRALASTPQPNTSVIFLELAGGPPQHETYDPKPDAPAEYRGIYGTVSTNVPGIHFSDRMPEQAKIMDKLAVIRSIHHNSGSHGTSSHLTQSGYYLQNVQNRQNEMPCIGSIISRLRGSGDSGAPPYVSVPTKMRFGGPAWLGSGEAPFVSGGDPNAKKFEVNNLTMIGGLNVQRMESRRQLLKDFDNAEKLLSNEKAATQMDEVNEKAFQMLLGDTTRKAFDISQENDRIRDQYGRTTIGQSMLLARRLVESGVHFVTVRVGGWDLHNDFAKRLAKMGPAYDKGVAALVNDLHDRGMNRDVMIVAMGEFGRTPKLNDGLGGKGTPGRDHWGRLMSVLVAGGSYQMGQVIGASDPLGYEPAESPYRPENVLAMVYRHLGIDPGKTLPDYTGRPRYLLEERGLIKELI
jgi:hypothetical protein